MIYVFLDTCVLLDISTRKSYLPIVSALEDLTSSGTVRLVVLDIVASEYDRNKDEVADKTRKRLSQEFKLVRSVVDEFGGKDKDKAVEVLNEVNSRLPILSEANHATIHRVENLINAAFKVDVSDRAKIAAVQRGLEKRAPFHISKNSMADAVIIEQFYEFTIEYRSEKDAFVFVTHNHNDFSSKDHRKPHDDLADIFVSDNTHYYNNVRSAINFLDNDLLEDIEFEHDFTEETRGLQDILFAMDELVDKIWYNRHCNLVSKVENREIRIIPDGTNEYGNNVIHESVWAGAIKSARRVIEEYDDTGPWDDFEWGMLNGKLSALRWVLGDEWDMLDT